MDSRDTVELGRVEREEDYGGSISMTYSAKIEWIAAVAVAVSGYLLEGHL